MLQKFPVTGLADGRHMWSQARRVYARTVRYLAWRIGWKVGISDASLDSTASLMVRLGWKGPGAGSTSALILILTSLVEARSSELTLTYWSSLMFQIRGCANKRTNRKIIACGSRCFWA